MAVSPSTASPSIVPAMSIVAYASSMSGKSESARSAKRSRSASTCLSTSSSPTGCERQLDAQLVVADQLHLRADLDDGVELDVAVVLAGGDLDLGRRDDVDVVLVDRVDVVLGQRVLQRLLARDLGAEARFEQIAAAPCPGRKPGMRTSRASLRNAASIAARTRRGTVTWSLTRFATPAGLSSGASASSSTLSTGSTVLCIRRRSVPAALRADLRPTIARVTVDHGITHVALPVTDLSRASISTRVRAACRWCISAPTPTPVRRWPGSAI